MKYLFICVHPDDLEFNCSNLMRYLTQKGKSVSILCLTKGEFGIFDEKWKGPQLARIREHELIKAAEVNGIPPKQIHFDDIIDGFVRFDPEHIEKVISWINQLQSDIIFAPEPFFTYYWHSDHINCGRIAYSIFKHQQQRLESPLRSLFFYTSLKSNFSWPFQDPSHAYRSLSHHRSQWWLLKWMRLFYPLEKRSFQMKKLRKWKYVERYRRVLLHGKEPQPGRILKTILGKMSNSHSVNPPNQHYTVPDLESPFGQEILRLRRKYHYED